MFSELTENRFSPDYETLCDVDSLCDALFHPSTNASELYLEPTTYAPDDFTADYDKMMDLNDEDLNDDILLPQYLKFDIEKQPQLLNLVSPNDILPPANICFSIAHPFLNDISSRDKMFGTLFPIESEVGAIFPSESEDTPEVTDMLFADIKDVLEHMSDKDSDLFEDKTMIEMAKNNPSLDNIIVEMVEIEKDDPSLDNIIEEDILPSLDQSNSYDSNTMSYKTYHPDYDHCYSKLNEDKDDVWTSAGSPDSSGSSSEVDVVTVTEEQASFVPKVQAPFRKRQKKGQKSQKGRKNQNSLSPKTFNAAMKRNITRITTIRRTYRRKINNSVETTPSNSLPSSAQSSRCSSDVEDAGKRANHNSSERKRREVLRTALQNLRLCVPGVQNNLKAPKVQILNCAKEFIGEVCQKDQEYRMIKKNLKSRNRILKMKLKSLRAELALS